MKYMLLVLSLFLFACSKQQDNTTPLESMPLVAVFIDDGALQCERQGRSLAASEALLTQAGISTANSYCAYIDGVMMAMQCGLKDLNVHVVEVQSSQLQSALGFEPLASVAHHGEKTLVKHACPESP